MSHDEARQGTHSAVQGSQVAGEGSEAQEAREALLRAEVDRLGERVAYYRDSEVPALRSNADSWTVRAEAAEAKLYDVEAALRKGAS